MGVTEPGIRVRSSFGRYARAIYRLIQADISESKPLILLNIAYLCIAITVADYSGSYGGGRSL